MIFSIAHLTYFFYVLLSFCRLAISVAHFLVVFDNSQIYNMSLFCISLWLLKWLLKQLCGTSWKIYISINGDQKTSYHGLECCQSSEVELFVKTANNLKPLKAAIAKRSTLGIWRGSEYTSTFPRLYMWKGGGFSA